MANHPSSSTITLPYSDITLYVPKSNKRKRTYEAPFNLRAKISSATNFSELKEHLREMTGSRDLTPNTRKLCERLRDWIGEYCNLSCEKLKSERAEDIETTATAMQTWVERVHGKAGLCQTIIDYHQEMVHKRLVLDFGDLLAADWSDFKRKSMGTNQKSSKGSKALKNTWHGQERYDSQHVAEMVLDEKEQKRRYGAVLYPKGDSANGVLAEIAEAAEKLGKEAEQIEWEIVTYAERNSIAHNSIEKDAMNGYLSKAAFTLAKSRQELKEMLLDQQERLAWEHCMDAFQQRWFASYDEADFRRYGVSPYYTASELGKQAVDRRRKREEDDPGLEKNKNELKESYGKREEKGGEQD
jgi:hypothetical protein